MQLDLFELDSIDQAKETRQAIYEKLRHYGVDDYFYKNIKGECMVFWQIENNLNRISDYEKYMNELTSLLQSIVPTIPYRKSFDRVGNYLLRHDDGSLAYKTRKVLNGIFYCLEMIPEDLFRA